MAKEYDFFIDGQPSIYKPKERKLRIFFSEPDSGVNKDTGILLFIAGFGGNANSKVYKKMRNRFADQYNLVTIQCDYFGWDFMQSFSYANLRFYNIVKQLQEQLTANQLKEVLADQPFTFQKLVGYVNEKNIKISLDAEANLEEDLTYFADMGIMQSIDNITAVMAVQAVLRDNSLEYNQNKTLIFGHSHGAYLGYLVNAFAPNLFSMIIDNSAWPFPVFLNENRFVYVNHGNILLNIKHDYFAKRYERDEEILSLHQLYRKFDNQCKIITFQGVTDKLVSHKEKKELCAHIPHCIYHEITHKEINDIFKSTNHGLDADFLRMFDYVISKYKDELEKTEANTYNFVRYTTNYNRYEVDYRDGRPFIYVYKNGEL